MKKTLILASVFLGGMEVYAQLGPNGNCLSSPSLNGAGSSQAWLRGGNQLFGPGGNDNRFGLCFNSPIYFITNNEFRMKLNGDITYSVAGYNQPRDGYLLLGEALTPPPTVNQIYSSGNYGAFSLLHLNGAGGFVQVGGHRDWMKTGVTFTSNNDLSYFGHRQVGLLDKTELVIGWSDNAGVGPAGKDVVSFRFTAGPPPPAYTNIPSETNNAADLSGTDNDGREVLRMMGTGNVGIGPRFNQNVDPQSSLHQHEENDQSSWHQFTNQNLNSPATNNAPTAIAESNGLRLGILGANNDQKNGLAMLYNQELKPLLFSTNANTTVANANATLERFRLMSYGTPTDLGGAAYGNFTPYAGMTANITRVGISHNPAAPLTRPLALLHLGYNNNSGTNTFGHRRWMDVGTFTSELNDHMYVGLKTSPSGAHDAIVNWGTTAGFNNPDVLRFTFTQATTLSTTAAGSEGLEIARMWSDGNIGRTGFGNFPGLGVGAQPQNTVHINSVNLDELTPGGGSGLRLQDLRSNTPTIPNPGTGVLAVDANGDVIYVDGAAGSTLGGLCTSPSTAPVLAGDWEIPMDSNNFVFSDPATTLLDGENFVGIGTGCTPTAKLEVIRNVTTNTLSTVVGSRFENNDLASNTNYLGFGQGLYAVATGSNRENVGVYGDSKGGQSNYGVRGRSAQTYASTPAALANFGMIGEGLNGLNNVGVSGNANSTNPLTQNNKGGNFFASGAKFSYGAYNAASCFTPGGQDNIGSFNTAGTGVGGATVNNIGVVGIASVSGGGTATNTYGVYGEGATFGGYFVGGITSGPAFTFSDQKLKENVVTIKSGLELLKKLNPVTYDHKTAEFPELYLREGKQYGFIAQEVAAVIPELVTETHKPEFKDDKGNVISKGGDYVAVNYDGLIPVLTKSIQEQQSEIEVLKSEIETLKSILTGNSVAPANNATTTSVELSDIKTIVLDQNTPNPFAEQTTITYTLTDVVSKAQILFYNAEGKLINTVDLEAKAGKGSVHVFANDLSNGLYTYTLVADGKIIDTKRMLKNK